MPAACAEGGPHLLCLRKADVAACLLTGQGAHAPIA